jgi:phosphoribosylglycinamide formyltransferase-1
MTDVSADRSASDPCLVSPQLSEDLLALYRNLPPISLGVLASGSGSNFEAIMQAIADGRLRADLKILIYNNPGAKAAARAERWGVPSLLIDHRDYETREAFDGAVVQALRDRGVEWVAMAGWMRRATEVLVRAFPQRVINIHPSLLPSFPGIRAVEQALAAQVKVTGCTVHLVELEVDSGPMLMQAVVPVYGTDTVETLHARIQIQEHRIFPQAIALAVTQSSAIALTNS